MKTQVPPHLSLHGLMVLLPSYGACEPQTELALDPIRQAGAMVVRSVGCSDVALHRCLIAAMAQRIIGEAADDSTVPSRVNWVLWLDADMVVDPRTLAEQIVRLELLGRSLGRSRVDWPALSGTYVQRTRNNIIAARRMPPDEPARSIEAPESERAFPSGARALIPVHAGMGALMQSREAFSRHCREAERARFPNGDTCPVITSSMMLPCQSGNRAWGSEDFVYCAWEWQQGRGVYLDRDLTYGHVCRLVVAPAGALELPDDDGRRFPAQEAPAPEAEQ